MAEVLLKDNALEAAKFRLSNSKNSDSGIYLQLYVNTVA